MQREEKTAVILLAAAGLTLLTAYIFFPTPPVSHDLKSGERAFLEGEIGGVRKTGQGHIVFEIDGIAVFVPNVTASRLDDGLKEGMLVKITGRTQYYNGRLEVVVEKPGDIEIP